LLLRDNTVANITRKQS